MPLLAPVISRTGVARTGSEASDRILAGPDCDNPRDRGPFAQAQHPAGRGAQRGRAAGGGADLHLASPLRPRPRSRRSCSPPRPAPSYEMTGKVVQGSVKQDGERHQLRSRRPRRRRREPSRSATTGTVPDPFRGGREIVLTGAMKSGHLRRRTGNADHQVPLEVHDQERMASLGSVLLGLAFLAARLAPRVVALLGARDGGETPLGRRSPAAASTRFFGLLTACVVIIEVAFAQQRLLVQHRPAALLDRDADLLQAGGDVVEPGRLAAALGLGALDRLQRSPSTRPATSCARSSPGRPR